MTTSTEYPADVIASFTALRDATGGAWEIHHESGVHSLKVYVRLPDFADGDYAIVVGALDYGDNLVEEFLFLVPPYDDVDLGIAQDLRDCLAAHQAGDLPESGCVTRTVDDDTEPEWDLDLIDLDRLDLERNVADSATV